MLEGGLNKNPQKQEEDQGKNVISFRRQVERLGDIRKGFIPGPKQKDGKIAPLETEEKSEKKDSIADELKGMKDSAVGKEKPVPSSKPLNPVIPRGT